MGVVLFVVVLVIVCGCGLGAAIAVTNEACRPGPRPDRYSPPAQTRGPVEHFRPLDLPRLDEARRAQRTATAAKHKARRPEASEILAGLAVGGLAVGRRLDVVG